MSPAPGVFEPDVELAALESTALAEATAAPGSGQRRRARLGTGRGRPGGHRRAERRPHPLRRHPGAVAGRPWRTGGRGSAGGLDPDRGGPGHERPSDDADAGRAGWCWSPAGPGASDWPVPSGSWPAGDRVAVTSRSGTLDGDPGAGLRPAVCGAGLRRDRSGPGGRGVRRRGGGLGTRRGPGGQRRGHPGHPGAADERGGLGRGDRHQPHRGVPGGQAGPGQDDPAAPGPGDHRLVGRRVHRAPPARPTTPPPRPAWSGMARSMAREVASRSITVNVVAPGWSKRICSPHSERNADRACAAQVPLGRVGQPRRGRRGGRVPGLRRRR